MRHHRKLTDDERRQIIEARAEGTPATTLACRFGVSRRTIYNTLGKAKGARPARTRTISARVSARELAGFKAAMAARGITDHPAALRRLMVAAEVLLRPADQGVIDQMQDWGAEISTRGAAINQIARKLNEAKLRGCPLPFTAEDAAVIRELEEFLATFTADFQALWEAKRAVMTQEVDKVLAGLEAKRLGVQ